MTELVSMTRIALKDCKDINEDKLQDFIAKNPSVLGLGDLNCLQRERIQQNGGRLDILLADDDLETRYEVEIQLGKTDPSHIIRTIEYWDVERKRYPQYDHCAVIVAEEITGRFMNVISLFNSAIPLIAIQVAAYKIGDQVQLCFTKVLDRVLPQEEETVSEPTDRPYWENRFTQKTMKFVDYLYGQWQEFLAGYELNYNKFYIGLTRDGVSKNFLIIRPKKSFVALDFKIDSSEEIRKKLEDSGFEYQYTRENRYRVKLYKEVDFKDNKPLLDEMLKLSMSRYSVE